MNKTQLNIDDLLLKFTQYGGSDLHLKIGTPPVVRKESKLLPLDKNIPFIDFQMMEHLLSPILSDTHNEKLKKNSSVDIGYGLKNIGRFRFNIFFQRGSLGAVIRHIPHKLPSFEQLNLPQQILTTVKSLKRGLVLITGATGVGKSTTVVSLLNYINKTQNKHIITIEDPIEFLIQDYHSLITQRELGIDCYDVNEALKAALRQDPDIIFFSELRTKDVISTALRAAETGHLIFSTLHTSEAAEAITRILSMFASTEQQGVQLILASVLKAVFAQRLIQKKDKTGMLPIIEILVNNPIIQQAIIKKSSTADIRHIINQSQNYWGMQTFDQHLIQMLKDNLISEEEALKQASSPDKIKLSVAGLNF